MTTQVKDGNVQGPPAWFQQWNKENFEPHKKSMEEFQTATKNSLVNLEMADNPMGNEDISSIPVIGADDHQPTDRKQSTYTLFNFPRSKQLGHTIVGAAHCALPLVTNQPDLLFVELPESILNLGVTRVFLVDPYDPSFINPLPVEKDLIVIEVEKSPEMPKSTTIPQFQNVSPQKTKCAKTSFVVGRGMDCAVKSRGGSVRITTQQNSRGTLEFLLDLGEPGDSGTLLFVRDDAGKLCPIAVFNGVINDGNFHRRGRGTILPPLETLEPLQVVTNPGRLTDLQQNGIGVVCGRNPMQRCAVQTASTIPGAVQLRDASGCCITGVFVGTSQRIVYNGTTDELIRERKYARQIQYN